MDDDSEIVQLIADIRAAFRKVSRGAGISLHEAERGADCESEAP
jgi:hypothetical protein